MQKLLKNDNRIIRVLQTQDNNALVIDCLKRTMPMWITLSGIEGYVDCTEQELCEKTKVDMHRELNGNERKIARERFTIIAGILPFIGDEKKRKFMIHQMSEKRSKQTIRRYLCAYLVYQDISVLAPLPKKKDRELTKDEKNMRWSLNRYYYTKNGNSLRTAYTLMLKEKYCDEQGQLLREYPTFHQYRYFYRRTMKMQNLYIARDGIKDYQRNKRPLLGDGVQEFAPNVGTGMLDATICDIYLVNEAGCLVGRPILTACIDAYSGLCCGYTLSWEGGLYSLRNLMMNVLDDKVEWCKRFGISITKEEWNFKNCLPSVLVTDKGSEYKSENFEQITDLGVSVINLESYRPELKGSVEKFFDLVQESYKKFLKGKGVIESDFQERGAHNYKYDSCLQMKDFEKIVLHCIIYYNSKRVIENYPYTEEMIQTKVPPHSNTIFEYGRNQVGANLIPIEKMQLIQVLLPRTEGKFTRYGLKVNQLRYKREGYTEMYLNGGKVPVAYNPDDITTVYLIENGDYIPFVLIESRFRGKSISEVREMKTEQKKIVRAVAEDNLQAQISLADSICTIANNVSRPEKVNVKDVRKNRELEQRKTHIDFMKEGVIDE